MGNYEEIFVTLNNEIKYLRLQVSTLTSHIAELENELAHLRGRKEV